MADWAKTGVLPKMPELTTELTAPIYKFDAENLMRLEKKSEIKKRTGVSPDLADAIALTFAAPVFHKDITTIAPMRQSATGAAADYDPYAGGD